MNLLKKKSWRIVLMFAAAAFLLVWISGPVTQQHEPFVSTMSAFDLLHSFNDVGNDYEHGFEETGQISILFGDDQGLEVNDDDVMLVYLTDDEGNMYEIHSETPSEFLAFNGDYVEVEYLFAQLDDDPVQDIIITEIETLQDNIDMQQGVTGNTRWVNIACRFGDMTDRTPQPLSYFESLLVNEAPGMDDYWRTTSADLVNIEGSSAYGWYNLPRTKNDYMRMASGNVGNALRALMTDCTNAVRAADGVDFTQFGGINMMLNDTFGCCAWGGRMPLTIDGQTLQFRTTWLPPWAFNSLHVIAHEMGHGWGLPHSSGPYGKVYDSAWDVMSGGNSNHTDAICRVGSDPLGCWQVGTIGLHLAMLGWIPEAQMQVVQRGQSGTFTIDALTTLADADNDLLILVQIGRTNTFYTIEARNFIDYDRNLPGEAVILHQVVPGRASPAHVVDADNNGNPNDSGAMWLPGEAFVDSRANIRIEVLSSSGSTFTVRVINDN